MLPSGGGLPGLLVVDTLKTACRLEVKSPSATRARARLISTKGVGLRIVSDPS